MATNNDNNGLYFIVGALLVAVVVMGFMFYDAGMSADGSVEGIVPDKSTESSFSVDVGDDSITATTESEN